MKWIDWRCNALGFLSLCLDHLGSEMIGVEFRDFDGYSKLILKSWLYKLVKMAFEVSWKNNIYEDI